MLPEWLVELGKSMPSLTIMAAVMVYVIKAAQEQAKTFLAHLEKRDHAMESQRREFIQLIQSHESKLEALSDSWKFAHKEAHDVIRENTTILSEVATLLKNRNGERGNARR